MGFQTVDIQQAKKLLDEQTITVADIRDSQSYLASHVEKAISIGENNVQEFIENSDKSKPLLVYCYHGHSSQGAAEYFANMGFDEVYSMDGGFEAWRQMFPVE